MGRDYHLMSCNLRDGPSLNFTILAFSTAVRAFRNIQDSTSYKSIGSQNKYKKLVPGACKQIIAPNPHAFKFMLDITKTSSFVSESKTICLQICSA